MKLDVLMKCCLQVSVVFVGLMTVTNCTHAATTIDGDLTVQGNAQFDQDANVNGQITVNGQANLNSDANVQGNFNAQEHANFASDVSIDGQFNVNNQAYLNDQTFINNDLNLNGQAYLNNDAHVSNNFHVGSDAYINGQVHASGDVQAYNNVYTHGCQEVKGSTILRDNVILQKELGGCPPCFEFRDGDDIGGLSKAQFIPNMNDGERGVSISIDGYNPSICVDNDGSLFLAGQTNIHGDVTIHGAVNHPELFNAEEGEFEGDHCPGIFEPGNLHVSGTVTDNCAYKAHLYLSQGINYSLGNNIEFDSFHDAGNNIQHDPLAFVAPVTGLYLITVHVGGDLLTTVPLAGSPVAQLDVMQNGCISLSSYLPLLAFGQEVNHTLSGMVMLHQGESLEVAMHVWAMTEFGYQQINGDILLTGEAEGNRTHLTVHYLSSCENCN